MNAQSVDRGEKIRTDIICTKKTTIVCNDIFPKLLDSVQLNVNENRREKKLIKSTKQIKCEFLLNT